MQDELVRNPERGNMIRGLGGIRKARAANPARGKGKKGGYRYLFLYLEHKQHIHLLYLLDKDEQEDLDDDERKALRTMAAELRKL
jgi:hypothetical protein